ncbi:MAG: hypothetical protein ABR589_13445, partial [Chthoniobacterales bacterium]
MAVATPPVGVSSGELVRSSLELIEARDALVTFLQRFPNGQHVEEAKDLLGQVNTEMLFTDYRLPEKQEY